MRLMLRERDMTEDSLQADEKHLGSHGDEDVTCRSLYNEVPRSDGGEGKAL